MSTVVVRLTWSEASDSSGIKLYNVYRNDAHIHQLTDLAYNVFDEVKPTTIKYYVVALTNDGNYLKSNEIYVETLDVAGFNALNYTLNFDL